MFITKVQCYFASKDADIPVQLQIRPMVNGHPSASQIFPGSSVFVNPASVNDVALDLNSSTTQQSSCTTNRFCF